MSIQDDATRYAATERALMYAIEELKLRRQRDSEYETQLRDLDSTKQGLQAEIETEKQRVVKTLEDAENERTTMMETVDAKKCLLESEIAECEDAIRRLTKKEDALLQKCEVLAVDNARLQHQATELERKVGRLSKLESDRSVSAFELRKLLQETRFETRQLEQDQRQVRLGTRHTQQENEALLFDEEDHKIRTLEIERENDALRLSLLETRAKLAWEGLNNKACSVNPAIPDTDGKMELQVLREEISKVRFEYLKLLGQVGTGMTRTNVSVQTEAMNP